MHKLLCMIHVIHRHIYKNDDDAGDEIPSFSRKSSDMGISDFFRS